MLEKMRGTRKTRRIVASSDAKPQHMGDDGSAVVFDHHDFQTVGKFELGGFGLRGLGLRCRRRRSGIARRAEGDEQRPRYGQRGQRVFRRQHERAARNYRGAGGVAGAGLGAAAGAGMAAGAVVPAGWLSTFCVKAGPKSS